MISSKTPIRISLLICLIVGTYCIMVAPAVGMEIAGGGINIAGMGPALTLSPITGDIAGHAADFSQDILASDVEFGALDLKMGAVASAVAKTANNNTTSTDKVKTPTRHPRVDPKSTKEQIRNLSDMKRIYRNAFVGSTMHKAYEGPTQYPTWIDPYDKGQGVFNQINMSVILKNSRAMTQAGKHLCPVFWDL